MEANISLTSALIAPPPGAAEPVATARARLPPAAGEGAPSARSSPQGAPPARRRSALRRAAGAQPPQHLEEREVLHASRSYLKERAPLERRQIGWLQHVADGGQSSPARRIEEQAHSLGAQTLEAVGAGPGLERSAAQDRA